MLKYTLIIALLLPTVALAQRQVDPSSLIPKSNINPDILEKSIMTGVQLGINFQNELNKKEEEKKWILDNWVPKKD